MYFVYMLRCEDNSLYTGIAVDVKRRFQEHREQGSRCAKYTRRHAAAKLECVWETENRSLASKLEFQIKRLPKGQKESLAAGDPLTKWLSEKVDAEKYVRVKIE